MKRFLKKLLLFAIPAIILISWVIWVDFFKIFGFQDYYATQNVGLNREMITTSTFNQYREKEKFNSFIFGSSRSQAFKCKNWVSYLDTNAKAFHFDASGEGTWGISKKIEYIDELGDTIDHALIVLDRESLTVTYPRKDHLFISMPCVSKSLEVDYYAAFLKASLNLKFLVAYVDYSLFKTYRGYMGFLIREGNYDQIVDKHNCDIWYGYDQEIEIDSLGYYNNLLEKGVFYERPASAIAKCEVTNDELTQLKKIKAIFEKHNTNYKIVVAPIYDQVPLEADQLNALEQIFGAENIYNFSGKNKFTEPLSNFYETSHFRPHVANEIMQQIYDDENDVPTQVNE